MKIKPFEAGLYETNLIVVRNPQNEKQELFTEEEFDVLKFIKKNERHQLLALLMPNIGIAKRHHIVLCLKVLEKLKRLNLVDYMDLLGKSETSKTSTIDMKNMRQVVRLDGLDSLAVTLTEVAAKALAKLKTLPLMIGVLLLTTFALVMNPIEAFEKSIATEEFSYLKTLFVLYVAVSGGFIWRSLVQCGFLKTLKREGRYARFSFYGPFLSIKFDKRDVNLEGAHARLQLCLLGILTPISFASLFIILGLFRLISPSSVFLAVSADTAVALFLTCPFLPFDGAHVFTVLFYKKNLSEVTTKKIKELFLGQLHTSQKSMTLGLSVLAWLFIWVDSARIFLSYFLKQITADWNAGMLNRLSVSIFLTLFALSVFVPLVVLLIPLIQGQIEKRKKRIVVKKEAIRESLTFEERMSALEKVPLFAGLNDQERLALLNEMQPKYFSAGSFLTHQGEIGKEFYVLAKGNAKAFYIDQFGKKYSLSEFHEGDAFGEIALIDDVPRMASVVTDQGCIALVLPKDGFDRFAVNLGSPDRVKTMIRLTSFFRRHPLFSRLAPRDQALLIDNFRFEALSPGDEIVDSDTEETFYLIYSGKIRVDSGDDVSDTVLEPDDCFGYANAFQLRYFAAEGTGLLAVTKSQFDSLIWGKLVEHPELFF